MKHRIVALDGIYVLDPRTGFYEPLPEPKPSVAHPGLMLVFLIATSWAAFVGAGYFLYRTVKALAG
ncbi:hypothetical protein FKO01_62400 [Mesorhizobium sp. B2-3-3]|nr:hypothetical protein FKO01_62400 [Mesorhizobium sp. B2-3-3]